MIKNHRVVLTHPADPSVNLILTDCEGQLVDESDGRVQSEAEIRHALEYFETHKDRVMLGAAIRFLRQFLPDG